MTIAQERSKYVKPGFTFIELVIALAIMAVLTLVVGGNVIRFWKESKIRQTQTNLQTIKQSITAYYVAVGKYPNTLTDLIRKPADVPLTKWIEPFLDGQEIPKDAYNNEFVYRPTPKGSHPFELYSFGSEGPGSTETMIDAWAQQ